MIFPTDDKSSSIPHLIKDEPEDLKKLSKYFKEITTSVPSLLLLAGVLDIIFISHSKDSLVVIFPLFA